MMNMTPIPLNEMARELHALMEDVRNKERRIEQIKQVFKAKGSFSTADYIIAVREIKKEMVGPSEMIKQTIGIKELDKMGLVYEQTYLIVSVTPKGLPQGFL